MTHEQVVVSVVGVGWSGVTTRLREEVDEAGRDALTVNGRPLERDTALGVLRPVLDIADDTDHHGAARLLAEHLDGRVLVVDDAHHLDEVTIRCLGSFVDGGGSLLIGSRPSSRADLAQLLSIAGQTGLEVECGPLDEEDLGAAVSAATLGAAQADVVTELCARSGGLVGLALAQLDDDDQISDEPAAVSARVAQQLQVLGPEATRVAEVLAVGPDAPHDVVSTAANVEPGDLADLGHELWRSGLADVEGVLFPGVRTGVRATMSGRDRRRHHQAIADALLTRGGEATSAAEHLRAADAHGADAAAVYRQAGEDARFRDPDEAVEWFGEAAAAGADPADLAVGLAEAAAFAGELDQPATAPTDAADRARLLAVRAAQAGRDGRHQRVVDLYAQVDGHPVLSADALGALGGPSLVGMGRTSDAARQVTVPADPLDDRASAAYFIGHACIEHSGHPEASAPLFIEAAEALERLDLDIVLPDSAHALGALCLSLAGDLPAAEALLHRAVDAAPAGPGLTPRHRLLLAWMHLRTARYELPTAELDALDFDDLTARNQLVAASIQAGLARRSGDVPRLRDAWARSEQVLLRGVSDLFHLEPVAELLLAGVRLGHHERIRPIHDAIGASVAAAAGALAWALPAAWIDLQIGIEADDAAVIDRAAATLATLESTMPTHEAMQLAAARWREVTNGDVAEDGVVEAATSLAGVFLPWEASRLCGQAALRSTDAAVTRRLLEKARAFHHVPDAPTSELDTGVVLTPREVDVARFVIDGLTHREIGEQLFISAKTVEHHVARIRRKVGANSRAEMLAALREALPAHGETQ